MSALEAWWWASTLDDGFFNPEVLMSLARLSCSAPAVVSAILIANLVAWQAAVALQPEEATKANEGGLVVPQLPEGTPEELLAFAKGLMPPKHTPRSRDEMLNYLRDVSRVRVQAADKVLAQSKTGDAIFTQATGLKLESLTTLAEMGEKDASDTRAAFLAMLAKSEQLPLAMEAQRTIIDDEIRGLARGDFSNVARLVEKAAALLAANPNDAQTAGLVSKLGVALERVPRGSDVAALTAAKTFSTIFSKSENAEVQKAADHLDRTLRFLTLPGKPMEISGSFLDGKAFDQKAYTGKVVLVYSWATWCTPCGDEIPNIKAAYDAYHDKGLEVIGISLDTDRAQVEHFVGTRKIPWPILFSGKGWEDDPIAGFYGFSGIPQFILIGRDGSVITTDVRGAEKLSTRLAELFGRDK